MKSTLLTFVTCLLLVVSSQAQQGRGHMDIKLNKNILQPGDSLFITVDYKDGRSKAGNPSLATLELMIENEQGQRSRLRWPVINGKASGSLFLTDSLPHGKYTLLAGLQQRFFEVIGKIEDPKNNSSINAMLLTKDGTWDEQEVPVAPDGSFAIRNWLFEDNALLAFSGTRKNSQPLNIRISTQLDSSYTPLAVAGRRFYIGNPAPADRSTLTLPVEVSAASFADPGSLLPAVIVRTTVKTPAQQFNEENVSGLFRSGDEKLLSVMDDPAAIGFQNIFSYLQGRVAGLQIAPAGMNGGVAWWRGNQVLFFMDEIRVPAQQIASIPMSDIAIIKVYPPPFFGAAGGGGGIAVYTRRGDEARYLPAGRQVFKVKGYTPTATALNMDRLTM